MYNGNFISISLNLKYFKCHFSKASIGSWTKLVLVNASNFKGDWVTKFDTEDTVQKPFFLGSVKNKIDVLIMHTYGKYLVGT